MIKLANKFWSEMICVVKNLEFVKLLEKSVRPIFAQN